MGHCKEGPQRRRVRATFQRGGVSWLTPPTTLQRWSLSGAALTTAWDVDSLFPTLFKQCSERSTLESSGELSKNASAGAHPQKFRFNLLEGDMRRPPGQTFLKAPQKILKYSQGGELLTRSAGAPPPEP